MTKRQSNFEALRILAILMIVLFHYVWNAGYSWSSMRGPFRLIIDVIYMFGELGVNLFVLVTGYFLAEKEKPFRARKAALLCLQTLFYSVLGAAVLYAIKPYHIGLSRIYKTLFPLTSRCWWYATAYMLLYLFSPYINRALHHLTRREYQGLLALQLTLYCLIPSVIGLMGNDTETGWYYNRFIWMIVLYCAAGYVRIHGLPKPAAGFGWKKWLAAHMAVWGLLLCFMAVWEKYGAVLKSIVNIKATYFWTPNNLVMAALSFTLFFTFRGMDIGVRPRINALASMTFGIYLTHGGRSGGIWWNRIFHSPAYEGTALVFADMLLALITITATGILVETVRQQLEKRVIVPLLDKLPFLP